MPNALRRNLHLALKWDTVEDAKPPISRLRRACCCRMLPSFAYNKKRDMDYRRFAQNEKLKRQQPQQQLQQAAGYRCQEGDTTIKVLQGGTPCQ